MYINNEVVEQSKQKATKRRASHLSGFTLIELLIATAVFSVVLIIFLSAVLRVGQLFYKGVNMSRTQEAARNVLQNVSDDLQFTTRPPVVVADRHYFCIGNHRYSYNIGTQVDSSHYGLVRETMSICKPPSGALSQAPDPASYIEMLDPGMQVNRLDLTNQSNGSLNVKIHVVFYGGDPTVLAPNNTDPDATCKGPAASTQYCAVADYNSTILQRF